VEFDKRFNQHRNEASWKKRKKRLTPYSYSSNEGQRGEEAHLGGQNPTIVPDQKAAKGHDIAKKKTCRTHRTKCTSGNKAKELSLNGADGSGKEAQGFNGKGRCSAVGSRKQSHKRAKGRTATVHLLREGAGEILNKEK